MILAITMSDRRGIALAKGSSEFVFVEEDCEDVFPVLDKRLKEARVGISDLEAIVVDVGPGSFSGIRMCLSAVKVWAFLFPQIKVYPVSNLDVWAFKSGIMDSGGVVYRPAGRGNIYLARYEKGQSRGEYSLVKESELRDLPGSRSEAEAIGAGDLLRFFFAFSDRLEAVDHIGLSPLYVYPDDCSVNRGKR